MRFDERITFVVRNDAYYDPEIGEVVEKDAIKVTVPCMLSTMGMEKTTEIFGSLKRIITVARLQHPYTHGFDYVEIDEKPYKVQRQSDYKKGVLFLEGDANA